MGWTRDLWNIGYPSLTTPTPFKSQNILFNDRALSSNLLQPKGDYKDISHSNIRASVKNCPPKLHNLLRFSPPFIPDILWASPTPQASRVSAIHVFLVILCSAFFPSLIWSSFDSRKVGSPLLLHLCFIWSICSACFILHCLQCCYFLGPSRFWMIMLSSAFFCNLERVFRHAAFSFAGLLPCPSVFTVANSMLFAPVPCNASINKSSASHFCPVRFKIVVKSRSVKRNTKNARGLGRDRVAKPVLIFLTACSGISGPDIPSNWSIVTVNIITY